MFFTQILNLENNELKIEINKIAKQANISLTVNYKNTILLVTVTKKKN